MEAEAAVSAVDANDALGSRPGVVEFLPNGRPKATRRVPKAKRHNAERQQQRPTTQQPGLNTATIVQPWIEWNEAADPVWRSAVDSKVGPGMAMLKLPKPWLDHLAKFMPIILRVGQVKTADDALKLWGQYEKKQRGRKTEDPEEFAVTPIYAPPMIHELAPLGIFPMTIPITEDLRMPAFKLHARRGVAFVGADRVRPELPETRRFERPLVPVQGVSRVAKKYAVVVEAHWDEVCDLIQQQHGPDWLTTELRSAFTHMFLHRDRYPNMQLHVIAVVELTPSSEPLKRTIPTPFQMKKRIDSPNIDITPPPQRSGPLGRVVAGEIGYSCGSIYTSLTGAFVADGTGMLQLAVLQALLHLNGFRAWDLGMSMDYKQTQLGTEEVPRKAWVALSTTLANVAPVPLPLDAVSGTALLATTAAGATTTTAGGASSRLGGFATVPVLATDVIHGFRTVLNRQRAAAAA